MTENLTSQLTRRQDGTWALDMAGRKGSLQVEYPEGTQKDWVTVKRIFSDGSLLHESIRQGQRFSMPFSFPSSLTLRISCASKPLSLVYVGDEEEDLASKLADVKDTVATQQTILDAQVRLNEEQQEQIEINRQDNIAQQEQIEINRQDNIAQQEQLDANKQLDDAQQAQIEANTALNEAQERGIGEEAAKKIAEAVFGI